MVPETLFEKRDDLAAPHTSEGTGRSHSRPWHRIIQEDGEEVQAGNLRIKVIHTPGHTMGSICLTMGDELFSGDTLFRGSIGRTDLGGTSPEELVRVVKERLYGLDDDTGVNPGHGEKTTMELEKKTNPFLVGY